MSRSIETITTLRSAPLRAAVLACVLGPLTCSGIHEDELRCEEAVARLQRCCAGFDATRINCYHTTACGSSMGRPQLPLEQSSCVLAQSCDALNGDGAGGSSCARALAATPDLISGALLLCP